MDEACYTRLGSDLGDATSTIDVDISHGKVPAEVLLALLLVTYLAAAAAIAAMH